MASRIAILLGSTRTHSNAAGLSAWVSGRLNQRLNAHPDLKGSEVVVVDSRTDPFPLGQIEGTMAAAFKPPEFAYPDARVKKWSDIVRSLDGIVVLTPQHNWGIPGSLKTNLDHLYYEWHGKPVAVVTYGGHGGGKAAEALEVVLKGGLKMEVASIGKVAVALPGPYIGGADRVSEKDEAAPDGFLVKYDEALDEALDALLAAVQKKQTEAKAKA